MTSVDSTVLRCASKTRDFNPISTSAVVLANDWLLTTGTILANYFSEKPGALILLANSFFQGQSDLNNQLEIQYYNEANNDFEKCSIVFIWQSDNVRKFINYWMRKNSEWKVSKIENEIIDPRLKVKKGPKQNHVLNSDFLQFAYFVLLKPTRLIGSDINKEIPNFLQIFSDDLRSFGNPKLGEDVICKATPFGGMNPEQFCNTESRGIVSKLLTPQLFLIDVSTIAGCEGGIVMRKNGKKNLLLGMVLVPLSWINGEMIGFTICIAIKPVLDELKLKIRDSDAVKDFLSLQPNLNSGIVLVRCGSAWGTGVWIHEKHILTCSHVVKYHKESEVQVIWNQGGYRYRVRNCNIVFKSEDGEAYDIALLHTHAVLDHPVIKIRDCCPDVGSDVYAYGYPFFDEHQKYLSPTVSKGVIAKVRKSGGNVVMMQTTCTVHGGMSGGPICDADGNVIGVITCNVQNMETRVSYPKLNFAIPTAAIYEPIMRYLEGKESKEVLQKIQVEDDGIKSIWALNSAKL